MGEGDIVAGASCAVLLVEPRASSRSASFASVPPIFAARDTVLAVRYSSVVMCISAGLKDGG